MLEVLNVCFVCAKKERNIKKRGKARMGSRCDKERKEGTGTKNNKRHAQKDWVCVRVCSRVLISWEANCDLEVGCGRGKLEKGGRTASKAPKGVNRQWFAANETGILVTKTARQGHKQPKKNRRK